jgi:CRP-like cAMP-binding protein
MANAALLKKVMSGQVFKGLTQAEAGELVDIGVETTGRKGDPLFREGDPGDSILVLLEGNVEVTKKETVLTTLEPGAVMGEMSLLGGAARSATVTALSDVKCLRIPNARFEKLLAKDSIAALKVVHNIARVLEQRLAAITEKLVDSAPKTRKKEELADFGRILNRWSF